MNNPPPPKSYLDKFNAETHEYLVRIGARKPRVEYDVSEEIADFIRRELA